MSMMDWVHFKRLNLFSRNQNLRMFPAKKNGDGNDKSHSSVQVLLKSTQGIKTPGTVSAHFTVRNIFVFLNMTFLN